MKPPFAYFPPGRTFFQAIVILIIFSFGLEAFARTSYAKKLFPMEAYGDAHPQLDSKLNALKDRVAERGPVECIFIGSSQVHYAINPEVVEQTYQETTGHSIRCQNFGLGGLTTQSVPVIAKILIQEFQPDVIIFGTGMYDYSTSTLEKSYKSIVSSPWVRYQLGEFSFDGWLIDNSYAYRYYLGINDILLEGTKSDPPMVENGYLAPRSEKADYSLENQVTTFEDTIHWVGVNQSHIHNLRDLFDLDTDQTGIVVLELPMDPLVNSLVPASVRVNTIFKDMLVRETAAAHIPLWQINDPIPSDGWYDLIHLNRSGAEYFSRAVGTYLGIFLPDGILQPTTKRLLGWVNSNICRERFAFVAPIRKFEFPQVVHHLQRNWINLHCS